MRKIYSDLVQQARYLYDSEAVIDIGFDAREQVILGVVVDRGRDHPCQVKFTDDRILISCDCDKIKENKPCAHVVALLFVWAQNRDDLLSGTYSASEDFADTALFDPSLVWEDRPPADSSFSIEKAVIDYRHNLDYFTVGQLRELAARRGVKVSGQRREGILDALALGLSRPDNLVAAVARLSRGAHLVLDLLLVVRDDLDKVFIRAVYHWLEAALAVNEIQGKVETQVDELVNGGLAFLLDGRLKVPLALTALHEQNLELVKPFAGSFAAVDESSVSEFPRLALWLLLLSQAGGLECSPASNRTDPGGWPASSLAAPEPNRLRGKENRERIFPPLASYLKPEVLRRLAPVTGQLAEKIDYTARLLGEAKLWEANNPRKLTPGFSQWLQMDSSAQSRFLFETALSLEAPIELDMARAAGNVKIKRDPMMHLGYKSFQQSMAHARRLFVNLLRRLPGGVWIDLESLLRLVHALAPDFLRENSNPRLVWLELDDIPVKTSDYDAWKKSYGGYYRALLSGPLLWLGVCKLAWQDGQIAAFYLTREGEFLMGSRESLELRLLLSDRPSLFFEKDNLIALNPALADPQVINLVMMLSKLQPVRYLAGESSTRPALQKLTYQVTHEGLGRAFEAGWTLDRIQQVLSDAARELIPPGMLDLFQRCWNRYGRLHIYDNLALIQFGDDFCLPELLTGTHLGQHLLYTFNPRLIAVRPGSVQDILDELRSKGYTPRTVESDHGG